MNNDKSKVVMLISIILIIVVLIVAFIFIAFFDLKEENENNNLSTTTRRTVTTTTTTTDIFSNELTTTTLPVEIKTTTTKVTTTKKITTTKRITTTEKVTTTEPSISEVVPTPDSRETTTEPTTYPDSVDEWEWEIVNYINEERRKNGLEPLAVAKDLRQLAEEGADLWMGHGDQVVKDYLYGNSNYRMYTNLAEDTAYTLYKRTVVATNVTTDPYLRYLGVGVLLKSRGLSGLPTYYYVIIYE